jgi:hypothetical protein
MPRRKPDQVIEHRIALGHWERERIKSYEAVTAAAVILPTVGIAAAGVGAALAGFALYQFLKDGPFKELEEAWDEAKEWATKGFNPPTEMILSYDSATPEQQQVIDDYRKEHPWWEAFNPFNWRPPWDLPDYYNED